jgi:tetratricopeptide (TPR) repeat protein
MREKGSKSIALLVCVGITLCLTGRALAQQGKDVRACQSTEPEIRIAACSRVIERDNRISHAQRSSAYNNRGTAYMEKKDYARALQDLNEAIRIDPNNVNAYFNRSLVHSKNGDTDRQMQDLDTAIRVDPKHARSHGSRGWEFFIKDEDDRALADLSAAIRLDPRDKFSLNNRGMLFSKKGELALAMSDLEAALRIDPRFLWPYLNRGKVYEKKGDLERAASDFDQAIRLDQSSKSAWAGRALVHLKMGNYERAFADAKESVRRERGAAPPPTEADAALVLGNMLREQKEFEKCAEIYSKGIAAIPAPKREDWATYYFRGICHERSLAWDKAEPDLRKALELFPDQPNVMNYLGYSLIKHGKGFDEALQMITRAAEQRPDDGHIIDSLGYAYYHEGKFVEAAMKLERAVELQPNNPTIRVHLGDAYWRLNRRGDAISQWSRARELKPEPRELASVEEKLRFGLPDAAGSPAATVAALPSPSPAAVVPANPGRRVALVVGNSAYRRVAALPNPRGDAELVATALRAVGFQSVRLENDLAREKLIDVLRAFGREAESADWAVVYFAGHGIEVGGVNYLIPVDAKLETDRDLQYEAVALEQVLGSVEAARKLRLVILDACRDNPFARLMRRTVASRSIGRGLGRIEPEGGTLVAYAAKHGEVALDGEGTNSPFVTALVKRLPTPGMEINKLFRLVRDDVMVATDRKQEPFVYGSLPGEDFFFVAGK